MINKILLSITFFLAASTQLLIAQNIVTGTVKDEKGNPVSFATVRVKQAADISIADTTGFFKIKIKPEATLIISATGFDDTSFMVQNAANISVILKHSTNTLKAVTVQGFTPNNTMNSQFIGNALHDFAEYQNLSSTGFSHSATLTYEATGGAHVGQVVNTWSMQPTGRLYTGAGIPVFTHKEDTRGSRYLFGGWVKGMVFNAVDTVVNNASFLYNYDKISGNLLFTQDRQLVIEIDKAQIKGFVLYDDKDIAYVFQKMPLIDSTHNSFFRLLSAGNKYLLYKSLNTKFIKSDYHTDGIATTGNPYDEFVDESDYFIISTADAKLQKIEIKKKIIKQVFASDADSMNNYFSQHKEDVFNEDFVKELVDYLNRQ